MLKETQGDRTEMQQLLKCFSEANYTYKTNKYELPLLEFVGTTST
ncbi:hypothetical protein A2U01_0094385, partial [Trifolium medium]|nr:hypothetical protein [Trifolium medium]